MAQQQRGIDCRQAGPLLFDATFVSSSTGLPVTTGTATCQLFEVESDGTLKPFDFSTNAFLANNGVPATPTISLALQSTGTGPTATGYWSAVLATTTGLTAGGIYLITYTAPAGAAPYTIRKIQWGLAEGDLVVGSNGGTPVAPLGLPLTAFTPDAMAALSRGYLTTSGVTSPVTADVEWTIATTFFATTTGTIAATPYYVAKNLGLFAWTDGTFFYITSTAPGVTLPAGYWKTASGAGVAGPYTAQGTATGVPTVIFHGNSVLNTIQPNINPATNAQAVSMLADLVTLLAVNPATSTQATTIIADLTTLLAVNPATNAQGVSILADLVTLLAGVTVATNNDKTGYVLSAAGLDAITIETGVNARQALSGIFAAGAGTVSGSGTGSSTVIIKGGGVATTRISAACDGAGNRVTTLTLPS